MGRLARLALLAVLALASLSRADAQSSASDSGSNATNATNATAVPISRARGDPVVKPIVGAANDFGAIRRARDLPADVVIGHAAVAPDGPPVGARSAPRILHVSPRSGPRAGGTLVTVRGVGFGARATGREACRFSWFGAPDASQRVVPATRVSSVELRCRTPARPGPGAAIVTVTADGATYSGEPALPTRGAGSFAFFEYAAEDVPAGVFTLDGNRTGPLGGGTRVTIHLARPREPDGEEDGRPIDVDVDATTSFSRPRAHAPFRASEANRCRFAFDPFANSSVNLNAGLVRDAEVLNVSVLNETLAGTFSGDCRAACALRKIVNASALAPGGFAHFDANDVNATRRVNATLDVGHWTAACFGPNATWDVYPPPPSPPPPSPPDAPPDAADDAGPDSASSDAESFVDCAFAPYVPRETLVVPARVVGPSRVECVSPTQTSVVSERTRGPGWAPLRFAVEVEYSQDGIAWTRLLDASGAPASFEYAHAAPRVAHARTMSVAGGRKARGPFSGNTEVILDGEGFLPSDGGLVASFALNVTNLAPGTPEEVRHSPSPCWYDGPRRVRCLTPAWEPAEPDARGGFRPCFKASVSVSNDFARNPSGSFSSVWSDETDYVYRFSHEFAYCPVYVSTYGSNGWGEGTPYLPYRDLNRAIQGALINPRQHWVALGSEEKLGGPPIWEDPGAWAHFPFADDRLRGLPLWPSDVEDRGSVPRRPGGPATTINHDQIVLMDGIYRDQDGVFGPEQNLNLDPGGRFLEVVADRPGFAFVDCEGGRFDAARPFHASAAGRQDPDAAQHGALFFKDVGLVRCVGYADWDAFDSRRGEKLERRIENRTCATNETTGEVTCAGNETLAWVNDRGLDAEEEAAAAALEAGGDGDAGGGDATISAASDSASSYGRRRSLLEATREEAGVRGVGGAEERRRPADGRERRGGEEAPRRRRREEATAGRGAAVVGGEEDRADPDPGEARARANARAAKEAMAAAGEATRRPGGAGEHAAGMDPRAKARRRFQGSRAGGAWKRGGEAAS